MRKIIIYTLLAFVVSIANAQEIRLQQSTGGKSDPSTSDELINESFDGTFPPAGWSLDPSSVITTHKNYENYWVSPTEAWNTRSGVAIQPVLDDANVGYAVFDAYWTGKGEQSLITPTLCPNAENYTLEFTVVQILVAPTYLDEGIEMYVEISTNGGLSWTNSTQNIMEYITNYNQHQGSQYIEMDGAFLGLDLSSYINQNIKVRFRGISDFGGAWAAIDDVKGIPFSTGDNNEECAVTTFPWIENFEKTTALDCWNVVDANGDGISWMLTDDGSEKNKAAGSFSWYMDALYPDDYLISPRITLKEDTRYTLSYNAGSVVSEFMPFYLETYSLMISTDGLNLSSFKEIYKETLPQPEFRTLEFSLDEYAGEDIYIAFRHHESFDEYILLIDNVKVEETTDDVAIDMVENSQIRIYPNPATDVLTVSSQSEMEKVSIYNTAGIELYSMVVGSNEHRVNVERFAAGIYILKVITEGKETVRKFMVK